MRFRYHRILFYFHYDLLLLYAPLPPHYLFLLITSPFLPYLYLCSLVKMRDFDKDDFLAGYIEYMLSEPDKDIYIDKYHIEYFERFALGALYSPLQPMSVYVSVREFL